MTLDVSVFLSPHFGGFANGEQSKLARYRLRFVLQEFDLPPGGTVIGRSLDCHLTLEDPLISRHHARIVVDPSAARIEDMGSRNGVRVNGALIDESTQLRDGDRIRVGTQDFVFCCVDDVGRAHSRTTGQLRLCANCHQPYARELIACPNCEATEQTDEDTLTGSGPRAAHAWGLQLLADSLDRALGLGRTGDVDRIARRIMSEVEVVLASGSTVDERAMDQLSMHAATVSLASDDPTLALWVIDVCGRTRRVPSSAFLEKLSGISEKHCAPLCDALGGLIARCETPSKEASSARSPEDRESDEARDRLALARVERVRRDLEARGR
ncbi:MAG: FHA domain-containing protein [Polyangiaceae bacterium]